MGRRDLLVIPPDEPTGAPGRPLTAADPHNPLSAARMLALAETDLTGEAARKPEEGSTAL